MNGKFPTVIHFRDQAEAQGAYKLISKAQLGIQFETVGFRPGSYGVIFFMERNDKYKKLKHDAISMYQHAG